jgi:hypothetical protein
MIFDTIPVLAWCNLPDESKEFLNQRWPDYAVFPDRSPAAGDNKPPSIPTTSAR